MSYTIQKLATLAGISVRALHYYDEIGLLEPSRTGKNGYRFYDDAALLKLQQILFFRELEFSLDDIRRILSSPEFDMRAALADQRKMIALKKNRLAKLIKTIDATLKKINNETGMEDKDLYDSFAKDEMNQYAEEARQKWGNTDAYKQSQARYAKMTKSDIARIQKESDELLKEIVANRGAGVASEAIQELIAKHYNNLRHFYEPTMELYRGLAKLYVDDERFAAYFEKYAKGLAQFMCAAMLYFAE